MKATIACSTSIGSNRPLPEALAMIEALDAHEIDLLCIEGWAHVNPSALAADFSTEVARVEAWLAVHRQRVTALNVMTGAPLHLRAADMQRRRARESEALLALMERWRIVVAALQLPLRTGASWSEREQDDVMASAREEVDRAARAGRLLALELHTRSPFETPAQIARLLAAWPDVPIVYDPTHFLAQGIPLRATERFLRQARLIHLRDAAPGRLQVRLGDGALEIDWLLAAWREHHFSGHISIEYLADPHANFDLADSTRRLHDRVRQALA